MPDFIHDQGSAEKDPYIVSVLQPSSIEEFSGEMRFSVNIIKNRKKLEKCPQMVECPPQVVYPPLEKMTPEGEIHC